MPEVVKLTINHSVSQHKDVLASKIDDDLVLLNMDTSEYFGTEFSGGLIWDCINEPTTILSVIDALKQSFPDTNAQTIENDVLELLQQMLTENLIILHEA